GFGGSLEVVVSGVDGESVETAADEVLGAVTDIDGTTDVTSNLAAELPTLVVEVDRAAAAAAGTTEAQVGQTVSTALQGTTVASIDTEEGRNDVVMDVGQTPTTRTELEELAVTTPTGPVPLAEIAEVQEVNQPVSVTRADGLRSATITATSTA